jgi:Flp pilus assembly pilin Flp
LTRRPAPTRERCARRSRPTQTSRVEWSGERGQGLIEYGLILAVMAVVCTISLLFFSDQLSSLLSLVASAV